MVQVFVGTSGWYYKDWNPDLTLDWYIAQSGLNAIELNASFYRFPFPNQIKAWAKKGKSLRWVVKVHRSITHHSRFRNRAYENWRKFREAFRPLDPLVDFYLFQLPPSIKGDFREVIETFFTKTKLKRQFALEGRHKDWFNNETEQWGKDLGLTLVSVDAPELSRRIFSTSGSVYLRLHGRTAWYSHNYKKREITEITKSIRKAKSRRIYVFANNDHHMLTNARDFLKELKG